MEKTDAGLYRLMINTATERDMGHYKLILKNSEGEAQSSAALKFESEYDIHSIA